MSKGLFSDIFPDGHYYCVYREFTSVLGVNESFFLSELMYWLKINERKGNNIIDGVCWVYNTIEQWHELLPFMGEKTIYRTIRNLEERGIVVSRCYGGKTKSRTKWYSLNKDALASLFQQEQGEDNKHENGEIDDDGSCFDVPRDEACNQTGQIVQFESDKLSDYTIYTNNTSNNNMTKIPLATQEECDDAEFFPDGNRKMPPKEVRRRFGNELTQQTTDFVSRYIDIIYPSERGETHPKVSSASRVYYASLIMLCAEELDLDIEYIKRCLFIAARYERKCYDPQIRLVTSPHALGHWLLVGGKVDYSAQIRGTRYDFQDPFGQEQAWG